MKDKCKCGSFAINHHCHGRDGSGADLCDVCYWRKRAEANSWRPIETAPKDTPILGTWANTWEGDTGIHIETVVIFDAGWMFAYNGDSALNPPSHWMPVPPAPGIGGDK